MTAKWPLTDLFWAPELAKQACSTAVNIGDGRCLLLEHESVSGTFQTEAHVSREIADAHPLAV
jgi:hypothetical protein